LKEWAEAKRAIVSCPTNSIGVQGAPVEFRNAELSLPFLIAGNVYYCGYTARESFGASSYLIERPAGNVLVDCPRYNASLAQAFERLGGIAQIVLTHKDDIADHEKWASRFSSERLIHSKEVSSATKGIERQLSLEGPLLIGADLLLIPTPGHTEGHLVLL